MKRGEVMVVGCREDVRGVSIGKNCEDTRVERKKEKGTMRVGEIEVEIKVEVRIVVPIP